MIVKKIKLHTNNFGFLDVGDGHKIYFEDWGNQKANTPIFFLHGGPGGGFNSGHTSIFNPKKHRVIFFDQRGAGQSLYQDLTKNNSSAELISDISLLADHLKISQFSLAGGSWGSTLALVYAINNPDRIKSLLVWSIFLARKQDTMFPFSGAHALTDPEAWARFISHIPNKDHAGLTASEIINFYKNKLDSTDEAEIQKYADEWMLWEASILSLDRDEQKLENSIIGSDVNPKMVKIMHNFLTNNYFLEENFIIKNLSKISEIPCYTVHGRHDRLTPPISALDLANNYGLNLTLQWVNSAHKTSEPETLSALKAAANLVFV